MYTYELKCLKNSKGNFVVVEIKGKSETKISIYDFTANRAMENCVICAVHLPPTWNENIVQNCIAKAIHIKKKTRGKKQANRFLGLNFDFSPCLSNSNFSQPGWNSAQLLKFLHALLLSETCDCKGKIYTIVYLHTYHYKILIQNSDIGVHMKTKTWKLTSGFGSNVIK